MQKAVRIGGFHGVFVHLFVSKKSEILPIRGLYLLNLTLSLRGDNFVLDLVCDSSRCSVTLWNSACRSRGIENPLL